jgi:hypothetical protein
VTRQKVHLSKIDPDTVLSRLSFDERANVFGANRSSCEESGGQFRELDQSICLAEKFEKRAP